MSFPLSTLGFSLPSSTHNSKPINLFAFYCNTKFSLCKCLVAAKKKDARLSPLQVDCRRQALKHVVTTRSKLSVEEGFTLDKGSKDIMTKKFEEVYSLLKLEILNDSSFEWTLDSRQWVEQMLDYNVLGEDICLGHFMINSYKLLKEGEDLSEEEMFDASVVGWCIQWITVAFFMMDDFLDSSHTRSGQPCWFRVPKVGNIAINDVCLLLAHVPRILKKHFREKPCYVDLMDLFNEYLFQVTSGQMLDVITLGVGERCLSNFTMHHHRHIAQYTAGFPLFVLVACALLMAGEKLENLENVKDMAVEIGIYFQILNDYLDCFGDPKKTGKIGMDIESFKCSWLIVKAQELANEEQKKILHDHYGKANPSDVAKVKAVYNDLNLQGVFAAYESEIYDKLASLVDSHHQNKAMQGVLASLASYRQLVKMHAL